MRNALWMMRPSTTRVVTHRSITRHTTENVDSVALRINREGDIDLIAHNSTHLPMCRSFEVCLQGNASKSHSRRRPDSKLTIDMVDACERPFGACAHMDHGVMLEGSAAARIARFALVIPGTILDSVHTFEGVSHDIRRWWTDGTPEFAAAAGQVCSQRPLAHYRSIPHRPQSNRVAERSNRMLTEGARCSIVQSGLNEDY